MSFNTLMLVNNDCYKAGVKIVPKGIMVHSTGANNPWLKRYVAPNDGLLGTNVHNNHWNQARPGGRQVCVHAFIGKLANGIVAVYQTLPWEYRGWHSGRGPRGTANDTHISFEICEDNLMDVTYFNETYEKAVELCVFLCQKFALNPEVNGVILGHFEGHRRGIASNHADPEHWWRIHNNKSMDEFRKDISVKIQSPTIAEFPSSWAKEAVSWAQANLISDGTRLHDNVTREEVITMLHRFNNLNKKERRIW